MTSVHLFAGDALAEGCRYPSGYMAVCGDGGAVVERSASATPTRRRTARSARARPFASRAATASVSAGIGGGRSHRSPAPASRKRSYPTIGTNAL